MLQRASSLSSHLFKVRRLRFHSGWRSSMCKRYITVNVSYFSVFLCFELYATASKKSIIAMMWSIFMLHIDIIVHSMRIAVPSELELCDQISPVFDGKSASCGCRGCWSVELYPDLYVPLNPSVTLIQMASKSTYSTTAYPGLAIEKAGDKLLLTLENPSSLNTLTNSVLKGLYKALKVRLCDSS